VDPQLVALMHARGDAAPGEAVGKSAAAFLHSAIESLRPGGDAGREEELPYRVLHTCFVQQQKLFQAANRLGMSERQLSRERAWAISLLRSELESDPGASPVATRPGEPLPRIEAYLRRPAVTDAIRAALATHRQVVVTGAAGVGKTSLVAELAAVAESPVLWYRLRPGVNDTLSALLLELSDHLAQYGEPRTAAYVAKSLPAVDFAIVSRLAIKSLATAAHVIVIDDAHVAMDAPLRSFLDEAAARSALLRVVWVTRHLDLVTAERTYVAVPPLCLAETSALLTRLGVYCDDETVRATHEATSGVAQLVRLAAAWLKETPPGAGAVDLTAFTSEGEVRAFLLETITDLLDSSDRAILEAASICRDRFSDDLLAAVTGLSRGEVRDASHRLVRVHAATRSRDGDCAFFHSSVRDFIYERLPLRRRADLHAAAARWFAASGNAAEARFHEQAALNAGGAAPATG
ncbi:MAG: AAA family ATPase, partial [Mycobacteriales bacterium]